MTSLHIRARARGMALIAVLLATALLLVLVAALVDIGTVRLQKATADLRAVQAIAGADGGTAWVRAVLQQHRGDVAATVLRLGAMQSRRRFSIDDRTYVVATVSVTQPAAGTVDDHVDMNLEQYPQAAEQPLQVVSSAALYVDSVAVTYRTTVTLLRVFPVAPYSEVVGVIDDAGPVGIYSPGDAGGQAGGPNATELLVHAYASGAGGEPHKVDQFGTLSWSDNNSTGPGALP